VSLPLPRSSLMYWHPVKNAWVMPEGPVSVQLGFSERDIRQQMMLPQPDVSPIPAGTSTPAETNAPVH